MHMFKRSVVSIGKKAPLLAAVLALGSSAALAQQGIPDLASMSGQMHAAAEFCGDYSAAQLEDMKQKQKAAAAGAGMTPAAYDASFSSAYGSAKAKLATLGAADKEKTCKQLRAMSAAK